MSDVSAATEEPLWSYKHLAVAEVAEPGIQRVNDGRRTVNRYYCCAGLAMLLVLVSTTAACVVIVAIHVRSTPEPLHIAVAINEDGLELCQRRLSLNMRLPCLTTNGRMLTSNTAIKPLACSVGDVTCEESPFKLTQEGSGIVVPVTGIYKVFSQVTFVDDIDYIVEASVRIHRPDGHSKCDRPSNARGSQKRQSRMKSRCDWLTCVMHHPKSNTTEYSLCIINGVRQLRAGDVVSFVIGQSFRSVMVEPAATHFYIYKL